MKTSIGKKIFIVSIGVIIILAIPTVSLILLSNETVTEFIKNRLEITKGEAIDYILSFLSIAIPFLLGVVVYLQSQRINDLESTQFNTFIAVEDVDYSWVLSDHLFFDSIQSDFHVSYVFSSSQKFLLTSVDIGKGTSHTPLIIPLTFITKNNPLIVAVEYKSVDVVLLDNDRDVFRQKLYNQSQTPINTILKDDSRFVLGFGMIGSDAYSFNEVDLQFLIVLEDQNGNKNKFLVKVILVRGTDGQTFYLSSSKTTLK